MDTLHRDTFDLADSLAKGESFGGAAYRRAVSSAYYSVFQRLSSLCAVRFAGLDFTSEEYLKLYRALDHKQVRAALNRSPYRFDLGARFEQLQDARHWADYSVASHPDQDKSAAGKDFSASEAQLYVNIARETLQIVDALDSAAQLKLAVLLIVRDR